MTQLPRSQCGTVAILASGPSLAAEDVDFVRGKATVIAVNDAVELAPWADVLYSSDQAWWQKRKWAQDFSGVRVMVDPIKANPKHNAAAESHGVLVLKNTGKDGIEVSPDGLRTALNSGGAAINLAVHMEAKRIVLLGYDMGVSNGKKNFNRAAPSYSPYEVFIEKIGTMAEPLAKAGIAVVNCSRLTKLTCFPRMALAEAFQHQMAVAS